MADFVISLQDSVDTSKVVELQIGNYILGAPGAKGDKGDTGDVTPEATAAMNDAQAAAAAAANSATSAAASALDAGAAGTAAASALTTQVRNDLANNSDPTKGDAMVGVRQPFTGAVGRTQYSKNAGYVDSGDTAADRTGVLDASTHLQYLFDSAPNAGVTILPGTYKLDADVVILSKGAGGSGAFRVEATGAIFVGAGRLIIDSCKRVQINGLDMTNQDLVWRGQWWGQYNNMKFRSLIIGDAAGTSFNSSYWTQFNQCQFQRIVFHANATSACNEITFNSCSLRGAADQGFTGTAAYALEFNANQNVQGWKFVGGDMSYHATAIYYVDAANTGGDIEVLFDGVYFDSVLPAPSDRNDTHIITRDCHHANGTAYVATLPQFTAGSVDLYRADRHWRHNAAQGINLIPNGDLQQTLTTWTGTGFPIGSLNSATLTVQSGGLSGIYLNINQALTASNAVRFRPRGLPHAGRATGTIVLRNADAGTKSITIGFAGLTPPVQVSNSEWSVVRLTSGASLASASVNDIIVSTGDGTGYNIDVAYFGVTMGEGSEMVVPSTGFRTIEYSQTHDFSSVAAGASVFVDFTVTGAALGDFALVSSSSGLLGLQATANVNAANTVRILLQNTTGSAVDLGVATWYVRVWRRTYV